MATIGKKFVDLIDLYKREDATRQVAVVIELLSQSNPILQDAIAIECNEGRRHLTTVRTGLPEVTWSQFYKGISQSKSTTAQVHDTTGLVEGLSTVDKRLLDISKDPNAVRLSEAEPFFEAISQEVASTIFYGNDALDPTKFLGLAPRFSDTTAANGGQIVKGGGSGSDNTSIWFVTWGDTKSHLIYPEGTAAGVRREDKGEQRAVDGSGNPYFVMEELFSQHIGLCVRDWRSVARIANIDVSSLASTDLFALMRQAFWKINRHRQPGTQTVIYANADVLEALDAQTTPTTSTGSANTPVRLTPMQVDGQEVMSYRGIPIRQCDAIVNTEDLVT